MAAAVVVSRDDADPPPEPAAAPAAPAASETPSAPDVTAPTTPETAPVEPETATAPAEDSPAADDPTAPTATTQGQTSAGPGRQTKTRPAGKKRARAKTPPPTRPPVIIGQGDVRPEYPHGGYGMTPPPAPKQ